MKKLTVGDPVVYRVYKVSARPPPRAKEVYPAASGETYSYAVDKYWVVSAVLPDGRLEVVTRTGKVHQLDPTDPALHKAGLFEKLRLQERFPQLTDVLGLRAMLFQQRPSDHEDLQNELFLICMGMFLIAVLALVGHLTKLHWR